MRRIPTDQPKGQAISLELDGETIPAHEGEPAAASLLAAGEVVFSRSLKYHRPRGPFCFQAACSHCLMRVDGVPNVHTCRAPAKPGMKLERQNAFPSAKVDVFGAIDWLFPKGLDHHAMFAGVPVAEQVMTKVARHLAGLGVLPGAAPPPRLPAATLNAKVAIAGGGVAGSTIAAALLAKGISFLLFERDGYFGGRFLNGAPEEGMPSAPPLVSDPSARASASVIGLFDDEHGRYFAVVQYGPGGPKLLKAYADLFVIAVGGYPALAPFGNNDLPGVYAGRAVSTLIRRHGVLVGDRIAVVGRGPELFPLAALIRKAGAEIPAIVQLGGELSHDAPEGAVVGEVLAAHGRRGVTGLTVQVSGKKKKLECDAVALSLPPSPSFELPRQAGAKVSFDERLQAFVVEADGFGQTQAKGVFVAGEVTGAKTLVQAVAHAKVVADAVIRSAS